MESVDSRWSLSALIARHDHESRINPKECETSEEILELPNNGSLKRSQFEGRDSATPASTSLQAQESAHKLENRRQWSHTYRNAEIAQQSPRQTLSMDQDLAKFSQRDWNGNFDLVSHTQDGRSRASIASYESSKLTMVQSERNVKLQKRFLKS